jgi:hypothetical protein
VLARQELFKENKKVNMGVILPGKNEYRIFKHAESNKKGTKVEMRKIDGMKQFRLQLHTWECHNETPCIAIVNKNAFFQKWRTGR